MLLAFLYEFHMLSEPTILCVNSLCEVHITFRCKMWRFMLSTLKMASHITQWRHMHLHFMESNTQNI